MISSDRIFIWKAFREWKSVLGDMYRDILTPELEAKVRQSATDIKYGDDTETFEKLSGHSIDSMITKEKIDEFRQRYSHIRAYHACRTSDVQSYYEKGILPSIALKDVQLARFREIFLNGDFPELTEEMLQQSIEKVGPKDEDLCLVIDDRFIIEYCGHYLIYGGEYMGNLVSQLPIENIEPYRSVLMKIGKPTFIKINLPNINKYASNGNIWELNSEILTEWLYNIANSRMESRFLDFTFKINEALSPKHIYTHYHPIKIVDPLMGYKTYNAEMGEYEDSEIK